jgi:RNA polymerase sigma-70 factor (ECF subfamily)
VSACTNRRVAPPAAARGDDFHALLVAALPRLRAHALALARNRAAAEDLVQDAVALALRAATTSSPAPASPPGATA